MACQLQNFNLTFLYHLACCHACSQDCHEPNTVMQSRLLFCQDCHALQDLYLVTMKLVAKKVPRLSVAYLNASEIFENNRAGIQRMKHLFGRSISSVENGQLFRTNNEEKKEVIWSEKYRHDLFYILPYYHLELPLHVKKLIVLDLSLIHI